MKFKDVEKKNYTEILINNYKVFIQREKNNNDKKLNTTLDFNCLSASIGFRALKS